MEGKIAKLLIAGGALMGAAVAMVPLTSYAATDTHFPAGDNLNGSGSTVVRVNVKDYLSLDAASAGDTIAVTASEPGTGKLSATVSSTSAYTISLSAKTTSDLVKSDDPTKVIPAGTNITAENKAWGVKKAISDTAAADDYTALTTTPVIFYTGTATGDNTTNRKTDFEVGVSVDGSIPGGDYSTEINILAAAKN